MKDKHVAIGIQQRLKSTRLPYKAIKSFGGYSVTQHVVNSAKRAANYINRHAHRTGIRCHVYLLVPTEDEEEIKASVFDVPIITGPEKDVLTRYMNLLDAYPIDYVVRITGDCPLIPPPVINKTIVTCIRGEYDFVTNAFPEYRTFYDGADCEIVSSELMEWLNRRAKDGDREHVTQLLYKERPVWCSYAHLFSDLDLTHLKLSVDTEEDLERVRTAYESVEKKTKSWIAKHGKKACHRY
jgi:spore coat polysaccharide biosynthesis protein SpsF (cytidylyltransferase family)